MGASLDHSVPEALEFANGYGNDIKLIMENVHNVKLVFITSINILDG